MRVNGLYGHVRSNDVRSLALFVSFVAAFHLLAMLALLVPLASIEATHYGWQAVFVIVVALNATAALLALFIIRPMRRAFILDTEAARSVPAVGRAVEAEV